MKHTIHTPTEQFGFVETEFDNEDISAEGSLGWIIQSHKQAVEMAKPQTGIPSADFNNILDTYLTMGVIIDDPGIMEKMSVEQYSILQAIKRSKKRTNKL